MNAVKFAGTFIIKTSTSDLTRLKSIANPDHIEGYDYRAPGLSFQTSDVLVLRNESVEKDQKVLSWLKGFSPAPWAHYNPIMLSAEEAKELIPTVIQ